MGDPAALEGLRARIRALEGGGVVRRRRAHCGVPALDEALGGLPLPGIVEISGAEGSGRARTALAVAARITATGRPVCWIDPGSRLYPPAAADHGVVLSQLLVIRPVEDGSTPWAWVTEQVARSGCFSLVVVDLPERTGSRRSLSHGWARAVEQGGATLIVLSRRQTRELPADARLVA
ncbi:MAG: recombinase RecA, partial [Myxococcales bacterium]|nr:recombinase RecA [Myxococcales bacterium]